MESEKNSQVLKQQSRDVADKTRKVEERKVTEKIPKEIAKGGVMKKEKKEV